jgi:hypothetical protein
MAADYVCPKPLMARMWRALALSSTNTMDVTVNVAAAGTYTIYTNTVNGYSFKSTGNFTSTGDANCEFKRQWYTR